MLKEASLWSPVERECLSLLQRIDNTRISLLQIHSFMLRRALETNVNLFTKFLTVCASVVGTRHARRVFDCRLRRDDTFLCNSMIKAHLVMHQFSECFALYRDLRRDSGFVPDDFTFTSLAKCCSLSSAVCEGIEIHSHAIKNGLCLDLYVSTALVDMYAKCGNMNCARKLFDEMSEKSQVSWTALIGGHVRSGNIDSARKLFDRMPEKDSVAYNAMIDGYGKMGDMVSAQVLFDEMPERNVISCTTMICGHCSNNDVISARSLFDAMPEKNLVSWNTMIGGYCQNRQPREALNLFHELQSSTSLEPDEVTIVSILPAIADLGALELGGWVHHYVHKKNLDRATNVCTALVDMYAKCGEIAKAQRVFDAMPRREVVSWNALINGFAVNGYAQEALDLFLEMQHDGFMPNDITMIAVLSACNHGGLVKEGKRWFRAMKDFGITPRIEHYGCMVDLLGRAGCLEEAEKLITSMPFDANSIILSSFLFACSNSMDFKRAERIREKAVSVEPLNDGNYVMLRNLYATENRWGDVEEIKVLMRSNGAKKDAGCSVIEVDSRILEFLCGHIEFPEWEATHSVLGQLGVHMRSQGSYLELAANLVPFNQAFFEGRPT